MLRRRRFLQGLGLVGGSALVLPPGSGAARAAAAERAPRPTLADALATADAALGIRLSRFDDGRRSGARDAPLKMIGDGGGGRLVLDEAAVTCRARATTAVDRADAIDLSFQFHVTRGRLANANVAVTVTVGRWSRDAYLLIPGAVYGGNRFASRHLPYPPWLGEPSDLGPHVPPIVSDVPRLNIHAGESRLSLLAADTAAPTVAMRVPAPGAAGVAAGLILIAAPATALGQAGIEVVENDDRTVATVAIAAPGVRADVRYALCNGRVPSADRGADLSRGVTVTVKLRLLSFPCPDVQALYDRAFEARRDGVGVARFGHDLPLSGARRLIETRVAGDQWMETPGIFSTRAVAPTDPAASSAVARPGDAPERLDREAAFPSGGDGGLALALPLLAAGGATARARLASVLDFQLRGQAASGFFHAASDGTTWWNDGGDAARGGGRRLTHVGRNAETLHLALRQVALLRRVDPTFTLSDGWRAGLGRAADAFTRLWTRNGQFGQYLNVDTGDIVVGGSAAGALAPAALARAARLLENPAYLRAALASAETLHTRFVRTGLTLGGTPASLQCPDSRSAAGLLESFVTLGEATGDPVWFTHAADVAHQLATWIVAWDAALPPASTLGRMRAPTMGVVLVSAQDKWGLPGFAGLSGDALYRLFRATGRLAYLALLRETIHNSTAYVATDDRRPDPDSKPGWVAARVPIGDAMGSPGDVPAALAMGAAQAACLLAATEIPSLYVQPDSGLVFVFDHVEARVRGDARDRARAGGSLIVTVKNPTRYEAELRIVSETEHEREERKPALELFPFPLLGARTLILAPGASEDLEFARPAS